MAAGLIVTALKTTHVKGRRDKSMVVSSHNGCDGQKNAPFPKFHIRIPGTCDYYLTWQKDVVGVIKLRRLRWGEDPNGP